jgi:hypothetical protein
MTTLPKDKSFHGWTRPIDWRVELTDAELDQVVGGTIPSGLRGIEGRPGNQGGPQHHP